MLVVVKFVQAHSTSIGIFSELINDLQFHSQVVYLPKRDHATFTKTSTGATLLPENLINLQGACYRLKRGSFAIKNQRSRWAYGKKKLGCLNEQKALLRTALFKNRSHKNRFPRTSYIEKDFLLKQDIQITAWNIKKETSLKIRTK